jgi:hypothetical protein
MLKLLAISPKHPQAVPPRFNPHTHETMKAIHKVKGYTLTLESHAGELTDAHVQKGNFSGSLAMLENEGFLENDQWTKQHLVDSEIVEELQRLEQAFCDSLQ